MAKKVQGTDNFSEIVRKMSKELSYKDKEEIMSLFKKKNGFASALRTWLSEDKERENQKIK